MFQLAYAIGLVRTGRLLDIKRGYGFAVVMWSIAAMCTAFGRSVAEFAAARFARGLPKAANFPAAIKSVADWFPKKERAFATGLFNAGSNVGAIAPTLIVPPIVFAFGWQVAFLVTGALGFVWLIFWVLFYERPKKAKRLSPVEFAYIRSNPQEDERSVKWRAILPHRQT